MTCAIYSRVSTSDKGQDPDNQLGDLRAFACSQSWQVYETPGTLMLPMPRRGAYIDFESGGNPHRPEFERLFRDASQRRFDVVLFWSLDRFSREGVLETLQYLNRLSGYGVAFRSFAEQYLDSCGIFREAVISILATIARQERLRMSERTRAGMERARAGGRKIGRPRVAAKPEQVLKLRREKLSWNEIAKRLGIGRGTAQRLFLACPKRSVEVKGASV
jgi:DNA invertase Pin-like site-specific DNA recombinase